MGWAKHLPTEAIASFDQAVAKAKERGQDSTGRYLAKVAETAVSTEDFRELLATLLLVAEAFDSRAAITIDDGDFEVHIEVLSKESNDGD